MCVGGVVGEQMLEIVTSASSPVFFFFLGPFFPEQCFLIYLCCHVVLCFVLFFFLVFVRCYAFVNASEMAGVRDSKALGKSKFKKKRAVAHFNSKD